ncbi:unknown [Prevotella sp. CAG:873]|nr:unknown [Prevotella sp. CAG:873]
MIHGHFRTDSKNFGVYTHIELTAELLAHTFAEFCISFVSYELVSARIDRLFFGLFFAFIVGSGFYGCRMVCEIGFTGLRQLRHKALNVYLCYSRRMTHIFKRQRLCIRNGSRVGHGLCKCLRFFAGLETVSFRHGRTAHFLCEIEAFLPYVLINTRKDDAMERLFAFAGVSVDSVVAPL